MNDIMNDKMYKQPILSICIPIYNRLHYLEKMLSRFVEDSDLFKNDIHLFISDNCSQEDLSSCCSKYQAMGLNLDYHRNEDNIGPDRNFELCFQNGKGKYTWLLGSDDIPKSGILRTIIQYLKQGDYGLVHLSMRKMNQVLTLFQKPSDMIVAVNYFITFMSANIIRTESLMTIDLADYRKSFMIQVPAYLNASCSQLANAIIYQSRFFEKDSDDANNGGYNLFKVFVVNLFGIYSRFVDKGFLSGDDFKRIKKIEFREFLSYYIVEILILKRIKSFDATNAWGIVFDYYATCPYAYYYLMRKLIGTLLRKLFFS